MDSMLRKIQTEDRPALTRLWSESFSDPERLIGDFFRLLPGMGFGLLAERAGTLLGAAYVLTELELALPQGGKKPLGYLYAVAVTPQARGAGLGARLSRACAEEARAQGCQLLCTQPAEPSLFPWYRRSLGLEPALYRREEALSPAPLEPCMELSATDYRYWRERMLASLPHVRLGDRALQYQHSLCKSYGGGFFAVGDGVAAAYLDGEACRIRELLAPPEADRRCLAASLAAHLGAGTALLNTADPAGAPYIAAAPGALPRDCQWNLSLD